MPNLDDIDPTFIEDLESSRHSEFIIQQYFVKRGRMVIVPPASVRPTSDQRAEYSDNGDIWIAQRWEVKHLQLDFDDCNNWPFPDICVDPVPTFDKKKPKPCFYAFCNQRLTAALIVDVYETFPQWTRRRWFNRKRNREQECYFCTKDCVSRAIRLQEAAA